MCDLSLSVIVANFRLNGVHRNFTRVLRLQRKSAVGLSWLMY